MIHKITITIFLFAPFLVHEAYAATLVGRLFSTPSERSALEYLRKIPKKQEIKAAPLLVEKPKPLPSAVHVQGYVKRADGKKSTVWINGEALQEKSSTANQEVQVGKLGNSNQVPIRIKANDKRISLKAGQMYEPAKNRIRESRAIVQGDSGTIGD